MYVAVAVDAGSEARAKELADLLAQYGLMKVQRGLWESADISPAALTRIKRDLDKATDAFDRLRFFQFPMEGTMVLTTLRDKKWRRMVARDADAESDKSTKPAASVKTPPGKARQVKRR